MKLRIELDIKFGAPMEGRIVYRRKTCVLCDDDGRHRSGPKKDEHDDPRVIWTGGGSRGTYSTDRA